MDINTPQSESGPKRSPQLPPMRVFIVRRQLQGGALEELTVFAHEISFNQTGALCMVQYVMVNGQVEGRMPRIFNRWDDVEELLQLDPRLVH